MINLKSGTHYNGNGMLISDVETAFDIKDMHDIILENFHFRDCRYGVLGGKGYSHNIKLVNCVFEGSNGEGVLIFGNGTMHDVQVYGCRTEGDGRLVLSGDSSGWIVRDNVSDGSAGSSIYMKGVGHQISGNIVRNAAKDCIKIRPTNNGSVSGFSTISNNFCDQYGLIESDAGGAINIEAPNVICTGNQVRIGPGAPERMNCVNVKDPHTTVADNILILPTGETFNSVTVKEAAEPTAIVNNNHVIRI